MAPSRNRYKPVLIWTAIVIAIVAVALAAGRTASHEAIAVRVAKPMHEDLSRTVATNGKVEPIAEFQAHAPFAGVVSRIYVGAGQQVRANDLLVSMSDADARARLAAATANLRTAEATNGDVVRGGSQEERLSFDADLKRGQLQVAEDERELTALRALQAKGAASASEADSAVQRLEVAQASLRLTQQRMANRYSAADRAREAARLADARAAVNSASGAMGAVNIRAPFAGTVYSLPVQQFDYVPGGDDLMDVADLNRLQIRAYFDEPEIGQLAVGQPVRIVWDAKPGQTWTGRITHAPTTVITYNTRSVGECIISVDDAKGELLPNTNVTVTVTTSERKNVLTLPREALHTTGLASFVYRVVGNKLVSTPVQVGVVNLRRVEIIGGLDDGATVALGSTTNQELTDGLQVRSAL